MRDNAYSGITVMCEAAVSGTPMIASRTGGAESYFGAQDILCVRPGDADELRNIALTTPEADRVRVAESAQKTFRDQDYSSAGMVLRYAAIPKILISSTESKSRDHGGSH